MKHVGWIAMGFVTCCVMGCTQTDETSLPLPPLLQNATVVGGWSSACPPRNDNERRMIETLKLAVSPEVERRLQERFPPGSGDDRLIAELLKQGFVLDGPCETNHTINRAHFFQKGIGSLPYDTSATVYWKIDEQHHIVWTKGFLAHSGL
jgi:hypothetical protein